MLRETPGIRRPTRRSGSDTEDAEQARSELWRLWCDGAERAIIDASDDRRSRTDDPNRASVESGPRR
eukprot:13911731-Alexandrium_andersonii.AAC.1